MVDLNKNKDAQRRSPGRGGLRSTVLVAVGAALGGAAVVSTGPSPDADSVATRSANAELHEHPDLIELRFNPRQERGSTMAKLEFFFAYRVAANDRKRAADRIRAHWNVMNSRVLQRCRRETPSDLRNPDANQHLERDLIREMSVALFPDGEAVVTQLVWKTFFIQ